jgi:hypothetical protein
MSSVKITFHTCKSLDGRTVRYARLQKWVGNQFIGQSVLLCRLSPAQLSIATRRSIKASVRGKHFPLPGR